MELVQFFNRKGSIVGCGKYEIAGQNRYWHKKAVCYIVNDKLQVLIQQYGKGSSYPNCWGACFALVLQGEDCESAIQREINNSLGIDINKFRLQYLLSDKNKGYVKGKREYQFVEEYLLKLNIDIKSVNLNRDKVQKIQWVDLEEYTNKIKRKNKKYLFYSKNEWKKLKSYLIYKKFTNKFK